MTAVDLAQRLLAWAVSPQGPPPAGSAADLRALGAPGERTRELLAELVRRTAARLGAGTPAFGDTGPVGLGAVLLAVAVGARAQPAVAQRLAQAAPRSAPGGYSDAIARHGVLRPLTPIATSAAGIDTQQYTEAVTSRPGLRSAHLGRLAAPAADLSEHLLDAVLEASPLTAVLYRPPSERCATDVQRETDFALELLARPRARTCLAAVLGVPSTDPLVLAWRGRLMTAARGTRPEAVIDVYLTARLRHGAAWDALLASVRRGVPASGHTGLPVALARFWAPLAALEREQRTALRRNPFLEGYRPALDLVDRHHLGEAA